MLAGYAITLCLLFVLPQLCKNINIASTKQLMKEDILSTKNVQYYVYYNLIMIAYSIIVGFNVRLKSWN
jgi:ABC-type uncharacterized transport system permease subunit